MLRSMWIGSNRCGAVVMLINVSTSSVAGVGNSMNVAAGSVPRVLSLINVSNRVESTENLMNVSVECCAKPWI